MRKKIVLKTINLYETLLSLLLFLLLFDIMVKINIEYLTAMRSSINKLEMILRN